MNHFKTIIIIALLVLTAVFTYQNPGVMLIEFLFWSVSLSACLMLLAALFAGITIGLLLSILNVRRKTVARKQAAIH